MRNSPLRDRSEMLVAAADLLCNNGYYAGLPMQLATAATKC